MHPNDQKQKQKQNKIMEGGPGSMVSILRDKYGGKLYLMCNLNEHPCYWVSWECYDKGTGEMSRHMCSQ